MSRQTKPLRVLALDIEGGHGGSSRSLLQMLAAVDQAQVAPEVLCRRGGAIEDAYEVLGIPVQVQPEMPRLTALERHSRNLVDIGRFFCQRWPHSFGFRADLEKRIQGVDLIHLNHISLFWLARWLRFKFPSLPITMHIRTIPSNNLVSRWQARVAKKSCSSFVFITENERDHFTLLCGDGVKGQIIYNPVEVSHAEQIETWDTGKYGFVVSCLSNFAHVRGLDRLIDVAKHLDEMKDLDIHFIIAGDMSTDGETLPEVVKREGVAHRFTFLGHINNPESLLQSSNVLLKPTRENNPWGRDILEALGHGVPVASVGTYDKFVESEHTGLLQPIFDAGELAAWLVSLSKNPDQLNKLRSEASKRVEALCDPTQQAAALTKFWMDTISKV